MVFLQTKANQWKVAAALVIMIVVGTVSAQHFAQHQPLRRASTTQFTSSDPAQQILDTLAQAGSDLSQPHNFVFTIKYWHELPSGRTSAATAKKIQRHGFTAINECDPNWIEWRFERRVALTAVLTKPAMRSALQRVHGLASDLGGFYEGDWEAYLVKGKQ